jgi:uncharacterized cofD-like protein
MQTQKPKMPKATRKTIVTIGGGSGQFALLSGLKWLKEIDICAVVSMVDSGGSTGRLRDELGILPPGDILKCILALSRHQEAVRSLFLKRFEKDRRLAGHNAGNMLLTMLSRYTGSFPSGVQALAEILEVQGTILPVTLNRATLVAELTDGSRVYGENAIDTPRGTQREKIKDVFLVPHHSDTISVYPPVIEAILKADLVIMGPGDLFTSIIPNLIVPGLPDALQKTKASLLYICNIMTKYGETQNFRALDFVRVLEQHGGRKLDGVIYNTTRPDETTGQQYRAQKSDFVEIEPDNPAWEDRRIYRADLIETGGGIVRHDPGKITGLLQQIIFASSDGSPGQASDPPVWSP